jgi:hypothetical protein
LVIEGILHPTGPAARRVEELRSGDASLLDEEQLGLRDLAASPETREGW